MTTWTVDVYNAKHVQGLHTTHRGASCNPKVVVEYAGERIGVTSQQNNTRDPSWNDTVRGETKEGIARRAHLTFKVVHRPEWAGADRTNAVSYARVFVSADNNREFRKKLMLKSEVTHEENGGWIEVGWHAVETSDRNRRERSVEDEDKAKEAMLSQMRTSPSLRPGQAPSPKALGGVASKKWNVGDKILYRDDDFSQWKTGFVLDLAPDGTPKVQVQKDAKDDKDTTKPSKSSDSKDTPTDSKDTEKEKKDEPKETAKEKEKETMTSPEGVARVVSPNQNYTLNHLIQAGVLGTLPDQLDTELTQLIKRKEQAVASEQYREAQILKEQIEVYKEVKERHKTGWRSEAPVSRLVKAARRIDFESGKCIEAGTIGEVIGGLVRMGSALFTPTTGDVEGYGAAAPPGVTHAVSTSNIIPEARELNAIPQMPPSPQHHHHHHHHHHHAVPSRPTALHNEGLSLFVVPQNDPSVEMCVKNLSLSDSVSDLKARVQAVNGTPTAHQCLTCQMPDGRKVKLEDTRTLGSYGIKSGDVLWASRSTGLVHVQVVVEGRHKARVSLPTTATVMHLKQRIGEKENIPVSMQCVEMDGSLLIDHKTLLSQGVSHDSVVSVYTRPQLQPSVSRQHTKPNTIHITVIDNTVSPSRSVTVDCKEEETIVNVRQRLHRYGSMALQGVCLMHEGAVLSDGYSLREYCIGDGAVLEMVWGVGAQRVGGSVSPRQGTPNRSTEEMNELRSQMSELAAAVQGVTKVLAGGERVQPTPHTPLYPRSPRTAELLSMSKSLRSSAEEDVARVGKQLIGALDEPLPPRTVRSPPRSRFTYGTPSGDIVSSERFRQMQRVVAQHEA